MQMSSKDQNGRRDFLRTATAMAVAGGLPTLDSLSQIAYAAGPGDPGTADVGNDYKAIVCVFLYGGQDHANILIPYQDGNAAGNGSAATNTEFDRYASDRANKTTTNPGGDPPNQTTGTGNLAYTRALLAATALPATTSNALSGAGGWTTNTHGRQFALNPQMSELASLFNSANSKLAVVSNVGPMLAPINRQQWYTNTGGPRPLNLYSHDDQQNGWMSGTSGQATPSVGIGGRIAALSSIASQNAGAQVSTQVSIYGSNTFMLTDVSAPANAVPYQMGYGSVGRLQTSTTNPPASPTVCNTSSTFMTNNPTSPYCTSGGPIRISNGYSWNSPLMNAFLSRVSATPENTSIYHDQWRQIMRQSIDTEAAIATAFLNSPTNEEIIAPFVGIDANNGDTNYLARQLRMVAAMIRASNQLGASAAQPVKRQIFFVGIGGFDTHGREFWDNNPSLNRMISQALNAFWTALGNIRVRDAAGTGYLSGITARDRVTTFTMSEFGRTLDSNGDGSDHGWGSFQFVMGGAVNGGKIYGQNHNVASVSGSPVYMEIDNTAGAVPRVGLPPSPYSGTVRIANKLNHSLNRGELLPTMASDAMVATIAQWFGVPTSSMTGAGGVFPTLAGVHGSDWNVGFMS
jgi:uncharacterized protein (DUF1501 family)